MYTILFFDRLVLWLCAWAPRVLLIGDVFNGPFPVAVHKRVGGRWVLVGRVWSVIL